MIRYVAWLTLIHLALLAAIAGLVMLATALLTPGYGP
jgi:hypothetical protein